MDQLLVRGAGMMPRLAVAVTPAIFCPLPCGEIASSSTQICLFAAIDLLYESLLQAVMYFDNTPTQRTYVNERPTACPFTSRGGGV
jgi:hypothetical protein